LNKPNSKNEAQYQLLEYYLERYYKPSFIIDDVIQVPHLFSKPQDIEIAGFFTALLAWGQRVTTISNSKKLMELMDNSPHDFIVNHTDKDLVKFNGFIHRTFQLTDFLVIADFLQSFYKENNSLETAFSQFITPDSPDTEPALVGFQKLIFSNGNYPSRTKKHIASPASNSACKRLNMYLRWMVRSNCGGVDFGLWKTIKTSQLICPIDTHVGNIAAQIGLLPTSTTYNWKQAVQLTDSLKGFCADDPVKYDFALFGLGIEQKKSGLIPKLIY